ncbi:LPXTG cell wall anchor domain-containing protein [Arcanobacterium phocae]
MIPDYCVPDLAKTGMSTGLLAALALGMLMLGAFLIIRKSARE